MPCYVDSEYLVLLVSTTSLISSTPAVSSSAGFPELRGNEFYGDLSFGLSLHVCLWVSASVLIYCQRKPVLMMTGTFLFFTFDSVHGFTLDL